RLGQRRQGTSAARSYHQSPSHHTFPSRLIANCYRWTARAIADLARVTRTRELRIMGSKPSLCGHHDSRILGPPFQGFASTIVGGLLGKARKAADSPSCWHLSNGCSTAPATHRKDYFTLLQFRV